LVILVFRKQRQRCWTARVILTGLNAKFPFVKSMPLEIQVIRAAEFIRVNPQGKPDLLASREFLTRLAAACKKRGINKALVDLRSLVVGPKPVFSPADLLWLVDAFHEIGLRKDLRLAVLYADDPHHRAKMFAVIGTLRGWDVSAFGEYEAAINWLMLPGETKGHEAPNPGEQIPVRRSPPLERSKMSRVSCSKPAPE
jgi:hypothetical protein